jgi:zinc/manganese transport system substrate-binding protein
MILVIIHPMRPGLVSLVAVSLGSALALAACGGATSSGPAGGKTGTGVIQVVAAENTWGSLAAQLGGSHAHVTSIVTDPNADPHEYVASTTDARAVATASFVIVNGAGYDDWASRLLSASPDSRRVVLNIASLVGKKPGDNPHLWYDPTYVIEAIKQISTDYKLLEPKEAAYFMARYVAVLASLSQYNHLISYIQDHFAHQPVASTESIFQYMAEALNLDLVTPYSFMKAVAEGYDPPARAEATFYQQIADRSFKVLVYNVQTVTPLTSQLRAKAAEAGIPVVGVSETIQPPIDTFQEWMDGELSAIANALDAGALGH